MIGFEFPFEPARPARSKGVYGSRSRDQVALGLRRKHKKGSTSAPDAQKRRRQDRSRSWSSSPRSCRGVGSAGIRFGKRCAAGARSASWGWLFRLPSRRGERLADLASLRARSKIRHKAARQASLFIPFFALGAPLGLNGGGGFRSEREHKCLFPPKPAGGPQLSAWGRAAARRPGSVPPVHLRFERYFFKNSRRACACFADGLRRPANHPLTVSSGLPRAWASCLWRPQPPEHHRLASETNDAPQGRSLGER